MRKSTKRFLTAVLCLFMIFCMEINPIAYLTYQFATSGIIDRFVNLKNNLIMISKNYHNKVNAAGLDDTADLDGRPIDEIINDAISDVMGGYSSTISCDCGYNIDEVSKVVDTAKDELVTQFGEIKGTLDEIEVDTGDLQTKMSEFMEKYPNDAAKIIEYLGYINYNTNYLDKRVDYLIGKIEEHYEKEIKYWNSVNTSFEVIVGTMGYNQITRDAAGNVIGAKRITRDKLSKETPGSSIMNDFYWLQEQLGYNPLITDGIGSVYDDMQKVHTQLDEIKETIENMQHEYRVAHVYSMNNMFDTALWRPYSVDVPFVADFATVAGKFANVYMGYWDAAVSTVNNPGNYKTTRALEVLGYDAVCRSQGIVLTANVAERNPVLNGTGEASGNTGKHVQYTLDGLTDKNIAMLVQEMIPETNITWLDAVTVLYKALGEEQLTYQSFMSRNPSITAENSPTAQGLSNITTLEGYNYYMFLNRDNVITGQGDDIKYYYTYWEKAVNDGFVDIDDRDSPIIASDFFILCQDMMTAYGEPVMTADEWKSLLQVYGSDYPVQLGPTIADAWAYLKARGCLNVELDVSDYVDRDSLLDICMCIKDKDSRTDYKVLEVVVDLADVLKNDGYFPVYDTEFTNGEFGAIETLDYELMPDYVYLLRKDETVNLGSSGIISVVQKVTEGENVKYVQVEDSTPNTKTLTVDGNEFYVISVPKEYGSKDGEDAFYLSMDNTLGKEDGTVKMIKVPREFYGGGIYMGYEVADSIATVNPNEGHYPFSYRDEDPDLIYFTDAGRCGKDKAFPYQANDSIVSTALNFINKWTSTMVVYAAEENGAEETGTMKTDTGHNIRTNVNGASTEITLSVFKKDMSEEKGVVTTFDYREFEVKEDSTFNGEEVIETKIFKLPYAKTTIGKMLNRMCYLTDPYTDRDVIKEFEGMNIESIIKDNDAGNYANYWNSMIHKYVAMDKTNVTFKKFISIVTSSEYSSSKWNNKTDWDAIYYEVLNRSYFKNSYPALFRKSNSSRMLIDAKTFCYLYAGGYFPPQFWDFDSVVRCLHGYAINENITINEPFMTCNTTNEFERGVTNLLEVPDVEEEIIKKWLGSKYYVAMSGKKSGDTIEYETPVYAIYGDNAIILNDLGKLANAEPTVEQAGGSVLDTTFRSDTIMNADEQILVSWSDMKYFVTSTEPDGRPKMDSEGTYYFMTRYGQVKVNNKYGTIQIGTVLYDLTDETNTTPQLVYIDEEQGNEMYFDIRCIIGVANTTQVTSSGQTEIQHMSIGSGQYAIYDLNEASLTSNIWGTTEYNMYNYPEVEGLAKSDSFSSYVPIELINDTIYDGKQAGKKDDGQPLYYWSDKENVGALDNNTSGVNDGFQGDGTDSRNPTMMRLQLASFIPTANWVTILDAGGSNQASLFVWYPKTAFENGFIDQSKESEYFDDAYVTNQFIASAGVLKSNLDKMTKKLDDNSPGIKSDYPGLVENITSQDELQQLSGTTLRELLEEEYGIDIDAPDEEMPWYIKMTYQALTYLYEYTGEVKPMKDYVVREFKIGSSNPLMCYNGYWDSEAKQYQSITGNDPGAIYWLEGAGFIYNVPSVKEWTYEKYLNGTYALPLAIDENGRLYNFNTNVYTANFYEFDEDAVYEYESSHYMIIPETPASTTQLQLPYGVSLSAEGYVYPQYTGTGFMNRRVIPNESLPTKKNGKNEKLPFVTSADGNESGIIFAPSGMYNFYSDNMYGVMSINDITQTLTRGNRVYLGTSRVYYDYDNSLNQNKTLTFISDDYYPIELSSDSTLYRVHRTKNYDTLIIYEDDPVPVSYSGFKAVSDIGGEYSDINKAFDKIGITSLLKSIDEGTSYLIMLTFTVIPMIGIIIMTILVGLSFISNIKFVQAIADKFIDPVRILTFGYRNIHNWTWQTSLFPCITLYIAFALFLNGNLIKLIMWGAEFYDILVNWLNKI